MNTVPIMHLIKEPFLILFSPQYLFNRESWRETAAGYSRQKISAAVTAAIIATQPTDCAVAPLQRSPVQ